eukprot:SAG11_NODE_35790_length_265_cov_0.590361_1_plen_66_part_10
MMGYMWGLPHWAQFARTVGLPEEQTQSIVSAMSSVGFTWSGTAATIDAMGTPWMRPRGVKTVHQHP